ncbi:hypothetical protein B0T14DRAFT_151928 [Immersiella caudata]|uniref:Uncharacterized protein n=1 Tax=Immersiella caudata TaxID=314043 RepID=A0AA39WW51_9PEZI|nr:hypothetical protein B0T14DRAFT_151928 [Immersiella caudata]
MFARNTRRKKAGLGTLLCNSVFLKPTVNADSLLKWQSLDHSRFPDDVRTSEETCSRSLVALKPLRSCCRIAYGRDTLTTKPKEINSWQAPSFFLRTDPPPTVTVNKGQFRASLSHAPFIQQPWHTTGVSRWKGFMTDTTLPDQISRENKIRNSTLRSSGFAFLNRSDLFRVVDLCGPNVGDTHFEAKTPRSPETRTSHPHLQLPGCRYRSCVPRLHERRQAGASAS